MWNLSKVRRYIYNPAENFSFSALTIFAEKLNLRCSTGFSIPTSLDLTMKTPKQRQARHLYVFIVDVKHILHIGFHTYFSYFTYKFVFPFFWTSKPLPNKSIFAWIVSWKKQPCFLILSNIWYSRLLISDPLFVAAKTRSIANFKLKSLRLS